MFARSDFGKRRQEDANKWMINARHGINPTDTVQVVTEDMGWLKTANVSLEQ